MGLLNKIFWLGHAGFLIQDKLTVYIDPLEVPEGLPSADVIFLTHSHESHCSERDVKKLSTPQTIAVGPKDCVSKFRMNQMPLKPDQSREILGLSIRTIPSYNPKEDSVHPQRHGWLGFLISLEGGVLYHPGDAGFISEMEHPHPDVLVWPLVGRDAVPIEQVPECLKKISPGVTVPMHYDPDKDSRTVARFVELCGANGLSAQVLPISREINALRDARSEESWTGLPSR